ncbi:uncharacterized protein F5147DRAFT_774103 [Suillus discolor]|uniref:Uncharacterized protein n=1 Tax=Suillus discolor TaxID=1912936 RepID=A0A9P7F5H8_9AGAM|nr:uncharacterized protein F5147DRAFT_774103 [Suillus discolor]KAG2107654.1 hypothetical protein F5147DRAFT_774103 [Suillus discolor]
MAELNTNHEVDIDENYHPFHGEEQAGNDMQDQGGGMEEHAGGMEEHAGGIEEHAGNMEQDLEDHDGEIEHAGNVWDQASQETFAVTPSAIVLWDYAQEIVQDDMEHMQAHLHVPRPVHPPIQMSHHDKCLLALMVEDRREALLRLWRELDEMEHLLGLEHI